MTIVTSQRLCACQQGSHSVQRPCQRTCVEFRTPSPLHSSVLSMKNNSFALKLYPSRIFPPAFLKSWSVLKFVCPTVVRQQNFHIYKQHPLCLQRYLPTPSTRSSSDEDLQRCLRSRGYGSAGMRLWEHRRPLRRSMKPRLLSPKNCATDFTSWTSGRDYFLNYLLIFNQREQARHVPRLWSPSLITDVRRYTQRV